MKYCCDHMLKASGGKKSTHNLIHDKKHYIYSNSLRLRYYEDYWYKVNYCPFCGVKLEEVNK